MNLRAMEAVPVSGALNAAIIGVSGYGNVHYEMLLTGVAEGSLRAIAATIVNPDQVPEKCEHLKRLGVEIFSDYRRMLEQHAGKIALCFIPTGLPFHAEMTIAALGAGACVYVEKPLAATVQDATAMSDAADRCRRRIAVGYQHIYSPALIETKRRIREAIGDIVLIKEYCISPRGANYYGRSLWAGRMRQDRRWVLDVPFHNAGAHRVNLMCFLAGTAPAETAAIRTVRAELYRTAPIESCDIGGLEVITASGVRILYLISHCDSADDEPVNRGKFVIEGTKGALAGSQMGLRELHSDGSLGDVVLPAFQPGSREEIMAAVINYCSGKDTFVCTPQIALPEVICANAAFESSPILSVSDEFMARGDFGGGGFDRKVVGLARAMEEAFNRSALLGDIGVPWAASGEAVDVTCYRCFEGGKTGF